MSDKLHAASNTTAVLPDLQVVTLSGRDAGAFAQAQFMSDVAALEDGTWQWSGWLTPKGRVIALFAVLRLDAEHYYVVLHDADPATFVASLKRFVFRSQVRLDVPDAQVVTGALRPPTRALGARAHLEGGRIELDLGSPTHPRCLQLGPIAADATGDLDIPARWRALDMAHGLPRLPANQTETWTPQQLSLDRLRAYSIRKGCYPGQEIVARTHFLGRSPRGLVGLHGTPAAQPGDEVSQDGQVIGRLVCITPELQLAVLPLERSQAPLAVGTANPTVVPILDGLAR